MDGSILRREPLGNFIPVFITAEIPSTVVDRLLDKDATYHLETSYRLHVVTAESAGALHKVNGRTRLPIPADAPAKSPFLGWDMIQVNEWFIDNVRSLDKPWAHSVFFVVDEFSDGTNSVDVVHADPSKMPPKGPDAKEETRRRQERAKAVNPNYDGDQANEPKNLRCDFTVARQIATLVERGEESLYENRSLNIVLGPEDVELRF